MFMSGGEGGFEPTFGGIKIRCQYAKCLRLRSREREARHAALELSHGAGLSVLVATS